MASSLHITDFYLFFKILLFQFTLLPISILFIKNYSLLWSLTNHSVISLAINFCIHWQCILWCYIVLSMYISWLLYCATSFLRSPQLYCSTPPPSPVPMNSFVVPLFKPAWYLFTCLQPLICLSLLTAALGHDQSSITCSLGSTVNQGVFLFCTLG